MNPGFNSVWGNLIYRNSLMHEAYMSKTWRFLPDFDKNIDNSSIVPHKKMKLKTYPLEWGTRLINVFKLCRLQFSLSKRATHQSDLWEIRTTWNVPTQLPSSTFCKVFATKQVSLLGHFILIMINDLLFQEQEISFLLHLGDVGMQSTGSMTVIDRFLPNRKWICTH